MPDDVETLQKMVRWLAEYLENAEEASATYIVTDAMWEKGVEDWIHEARRGVTNEL